MQALQSRLKTGLLDLGDDQQCWIATNSCWDELEKLKWTTENQVRSLLLALRPLRRKQGGDFINSQWCEASDEKFFACDAYSVRVDESNGMRRNPNGLEYYVKFSIEESGTLFLALIRCHLSNHK